MTYRHGFYKKESSGNIFRKTLLTWTIMDLLHQLISEQT